MKTHGNTILITGGGSGIGRGLAERFHALGNQVIISGRTAATLQSAISANPGMRAVTLDIGDPAIIRTVAGRIADEFPDVNAVIHNAGIMRMENLRSPTPSIADAEATIATNLLGPIRLTAALLPLLIRQKHSTIMFVSSGLAFVPLATTPTYCATKAALHSYAQSLRYQLSGTSTEVIEVIPPYVQTRLMGAQQQADPRAMPLTDFCDEVLRILTSQPAVTEVCVERVKPLRFAVEGGHYQAVFTGLNQAMAAVHDAAPGSR